MTTFDLLVIGWFVIPFVTIPVRKYLKGADYMEGAAAAYAVIIVIGAIIGFIAALSLSLSLAWAIAGAVIGGIVAGTAAMIAAAAF